VTSVVELEVELNRYNVDFLQKIYVVTLFYQYEFDFIWFFNLENKKNGSLESFLFLFLIP